MTVRYTEVEFATVQARMRGEQERAQEHAQEQRRTLAQKAGTTAARRDRSTAPPDIEGALVVDLMQAGLGGFERNYQFDRPRRWELDFAWLMQRVAIEVQGGMHSRGAHVRPAGYRRDSQKSRRAQLMGWIVLPCTAADLSDKSIIADVETALELRRV